MMKIGIADPQARVRFSLRILLEQQGWMVIGESSSCQELLALLLTAAPDLLLVDLHLPGLPAENLLRRLRAEHPAMQVVAMSGRQELGQAAMTAGADAFACKTEAPEKLLTLIRKLQDQNGSFLTDGGSESDIAPPIESK